MAASEFSSRPGFGHGHLAAIVESSSDAIVSKDLNGVVRSWNRAAQRIFGWEDHEIVGQSIRRLIPDDRQAEEDAILARVRNGELVPKFETVRLHKDGHPVDVAITVSPIRSLDGAIIGASKIAHDIGDELTMRQELRDSEARFRALADNIPQLAWMADSTGSIFWYNRRWHDYTGQSLEAMQGWGWKDVHHPDHVDRVVKRISHSFDTGEEWEDTFPLRGIDGEYRWFLSRAKPIFGEDGSVLMWFGTNTDITQQRDHEAHVNLLLNEINHRSKNMLAVIQAIFHRTAVDQDAAFIAGFERRLASLAANQDLLVKRGWAGVPIGELVRSQLAIVGDMFGPRMSIMGPDGVILKPAAAEALGLAIHELMTNAIKYGALSNGRGVVTIDWQVGGNDADPRFRFHWREAGGPKIDAPTSAGFGTLLLTRNAKSAFGGDVLLDLRASGLVWKIDAPVDHAVMAG